MFANSHFALATHVLVALSIREGERLSSAELARSVNTNPAFLRQLLGKLREAGLVRTTMGKDGGATLSRPASRVTLAAVYEAVEPGDAAQLHVSKPNPACPVGRNIVPILEGVVREVEAATLARLSGITIAELADKVRRRG